MIEQTNVARLFERRLNNLAKIIQSAKFARQALKKNKITLDGIKKLYESDFYAILDRKLKSRLRSREISKNMEPPAKRPFRLGSSRSTQSRPQPRVSFSKGGTKP